MHFAMFPSFIRNTLVRVWQPFLVSTNWRERPGGVWCEGGGCSGAGPKDAFAAFVFHLEDDDAGQDTEERLHRSLDIRWRPIRILRRCRARGTDDREDASLLCQQVLKISE